MKVLFINQAFHPDAAATAQQLTDFVTDLVKRGCDITVLTGKRGYTEPHSLFRASEIYHGVNVIRTWPFTFGRGSKIARILDSFLLNLSFAWRMLWLPQFDKIVAMTSPPFLACVALIFAKLRRSQFFYWVMDVNPDEIIEAGWVRRKSLLAKFFEACLRFVLKRSDTIIVLDSFMRDRLVAKGASPQKIKIIPPWSHDDELETIPHEKNPLRKKYQLNGKFVVMYSGNHSICHPLDTILEATRLLKNDPGVVFMFIGGGQRVQDVIQFMKQHGLTNIIHLPYFDRSELKFSLSAADLHVAVMGSPYVGIVHPCKIYGILRIGRPFVYVGPMESHIGRLISSEKIGYQVNHGESKRLVDIIQKLRVIDQSQKEEIECEQKRVSREFSRQTLSTKLADLILKPQSS